ncbi:MAG: hypothetical protein ABS36_04610 [Acidobacteria bacterium SCN 69-37]|nr:MAG: hypothetical protein ABS36_04610 [Acidobacteria bacterium SCN 69-37]
MIDRTAVRSWISGKHGARLLAAALVMTLGDSTLEAQQTTDTATPVRVSGAITATNRGISNVPALTLGRPAAIVDLAVRKGAVGFEPQFRFDLDGTPWSFLLWGRYRAVEGERFRLTLGGHPSFSFRRMTVTSGDEEREVIQVRRYVAGDITPTWTLTDRTSVGGYYLYSHGLDFGVAPHTHLAALRGSMANIDVSRGLVLQVAPQVYFLRTNGQNGTYVNASASLGLRGSPFSINSMVNVPIRTDVAGGADVLWNVSLTYAFR